MTSQLVPRPTIFFLIKIVTILHFQTSFLRDSKIGLNQFFEFVLFTYYTFILSNKKFDVIGTLTICQNIYSQDNALKIIKVKTLRFKNMAQKGLLPGYSSTIQSMEARSRYLGKIKIIDDFDPYEISKNSWCDDVDLWARVTYMDVGLYLLFSSSPYTAEQLKNYKSLDSYTNFANGWVRQILVKQFGKNRLLIAKVLYILIKLIKLYSTTG